MGENLHWEYDDFEFDNRVTNLMWTICGDYKEQMSTAEKTNLSKNIALYYGITAGGRRRFIDWQLVTPMLAGGDARDLNATGSSC